MVFYPSSLAFFLLLGCRWEGSAKHGCEAYSAGVETAEDESVSARLLEDTVNIRNGRQSNKNVLLG
jgi:hypothetical protein